MSKRARSALLTGGTGDVNPQFMNLALTESAANTFTQTEFPIPVLRGVIGRDKYQVMEVLKVEFFNGGFSTIDIVVGHLQLTTSSKTARVFGNDPDVIAYSVIDVDFLTGGSQAVDTQPKTWDLTDGAGHGIIVASQSIFLACQGTGQVAATVNFCRVLYRFKNISVQEFVGLAIQQGQ